MQYALLAYGSQRHRTRAPDRQRDRRGARPAVRDRLGPPARRRSRPQRCATARGRTLLTDGPFIETKEFLAGVIVVEADNLDGALAVAAGAAGAPGPAARSRCGRSSKRSSVALDGVFREHWGRVLATLVGILGDIELAEDAAQEAFAIAAERWPRDGEPGNPVGWLISTARNRAIDHIRRQRVLAEKTKLLARELAVGIGGHRGRGGHLPRRAAGADLHLLPPGAGARRPGGADPAHPRRPVDRGDRAARSWSRPRR